MSTVAKLLAQRQEFMDRLDGGSGPNEREEIQVLLAKIQTALALLEPAEAEPED